MNVLSIYFIRDLWIITSGTSKMYRLLVNSTRFSLISCWPKTAKFKIDEDLTKKFSINAEMNYLYNVFLWIIFSILGLQKQNDIIQHDIHTQKKSKKATFISKECNVNLMSNDVT